MNKNVLIRNLTAKQSERLLLLQKKFGVKTNTQALLLLLQYCVVLDDDLDTLIALYTALGRSCVAACDALKKASLDTSEIELFITLAAKKCSRLEYLRNFRKK